MTDLHTLAANMKAAAAKISASTNPNIRGYADATDAFADAVADKLEPITPPPPPTGGLVFSLWWQSPPDAHTYHDAGFTHYIGGDSGAEAQYVATLGGLGMKWLPFTRNQAAALAVIDPNGVIVGWAATDEPDNAQFGTPKSCMAPSVFQAECQNAKSKDPLHRMVYAGMGYQLGWKDGDPTQPPSPRGSSCTTPLTRQYGDYFDYFKFADLCGGDVYPVNYNWNGGDLARVADYQDNLNIYAPSKRHLATLECTTVHASGPKATPDQMRCELWLALIHGCTWVNYFPQANIDTAQVSDALARDTAQFAAIKKLIAEAQSVSAPMVQGTAVVTSGRVTAPVRVDYAQRDYGGKSYVFAACPGSGGTVAVPVKGTGTSAAVLGEGRTVPVANGKIADTFARYGVHLYQL